MEERFTIENDKMAEWAVKKIAEEQGERDRLIGLAKAEIEDLQANIERMQEEYDGRINYFKALLMEYFGKVEHKQTKTKETYKLLSGTLVMKKPRREIKHDDEALLEYFRENGMQEYIKVTERPNWSEFKKRLEVVDLDVVGTTVFDTQTGEAVECLQVEEIPEQFDVAL